MTTHLGLQRILLPSAQVSSLTTGSITLPSARGAFFESATSYESIATVVVGAGGSSQVDFTSIPQTFSHLQLRYISRDARSGSADAPVDMRFNGNSSSVYNKHVIQGNGSTTYSGSELTQTYFRMEGAGGTDTGIQYGTGITDILNYSSTTVTKSVMQIAGVDKNGTGFFRINAGQWYQSSAITSMTILPFSSPFAQYSHFALYGIKGS